MRKLKDIFGTQESSGISRRDLLRGAGALSAVGLFAALAGSNDALAGEAKAATTIQSPLEMRDDMADYARDPAHRGIGIFINLRRGSTLSGEQIGEDLRTAFASRNPPVPVEYRYIQSRNGTATDITFYVGNSHFTRNIADVAKQGLGEVLAHYRDQWPQTASLTALTQ